MFNRYIVGGQVALLVLSAGLLAACGSDNTPSPTPSAVVPGQTPAGLPFTYQAAGESSSPSFHIDTAGNYSVAYTAQGTNPSTCTITILVVAVDGSEQTVVSGLAVPPNSTKQATVKLALTIGDWRFQEGGGCSWKVTVNPAP